MGNREMGTRGAGIGWEERQDGGMKERDRRMKGWGQKGWDDRGTRTEGQEMG